MNGAQTLVTSKERMEGELDAWSEMAEKNGENQLQGTSNK